MESSNEFRWHLTQLKFCFEGTLIYVKDLYSCLYSTSFKKIFGESIRLFYF